MKTDRVQCEKCGDIATRKNGKNSRPDGIYQKYVCNNCGYNGEALIAAITTGAATTELKKEQFTPKRGITAKDLRAKHDNFTKVELTAKSLKKGMFYEMHEFVDMCGLSKSSHSRWTGNRAFDDYKGKAGGITYWGHPESIKEMKEDGVLI